MAADRRARTVALSGTSILIVDDDAGVARTFAKMLQLQGYEVLTALDSEAGLCEVQSAQPNAILLDLRMPRMDGLAFLRHLRSHSRGRLTPVAIITGDYFIDETVRLEIRGLDAELCFKPLWLEDVVGITRRLLQAPH